MQYNDSVITKQGKNMSILSPRDDLPIKIKYRYKRRNARKQQKTALYN